MLYRTFDDFVVVVHATFVVFVILERFVGPASSETFNTPAVQAAIRSSQITVADGANMWLGVGDGGAIIYMERHNKDRPIGLAVTATVPTSFGYVGKWIDWVVCSVATG